MITVSLCMIVKNEELTLGMCLESVRTIVDEIIIVDTGSEDKTKQIAKAFTDKVFDLEWEDDFSAARNYSFSKATCDYVLWLDADDIVLPEDAIKFQKLKENLPEDTMAVMMKYNTGFGNDGSVTFSYFRERLVKRSAGFMWKEPVHEYIETWGKVVRAEPCITHTKKDGVSVGRNLRIYENMIKNRKKLSARGMYYYARELRDAARYDEAIDMLNSFLNSKKGWIEDNIAACAIISDCFRILDDETKSLSALFRSFEYDIPRPEICCLIGYHFKAKIQYHLAIYWFEAALSVKDKSKDTLGFIVEDYYGYIPAIELSVCHHILGDNVRAQEYNERAAEYKPYCPSVINNRKFFQNISPPGK